jgi:hypothetical protein
MKANVQHRTSNVQHRTENKATHEIWNVCPHCGRLNEATTAADRDPEPPRPGDLTVCFGCVQVMEFYQDNLLLGVRKFDVVQLGAEEAKEIEELQRTIREAKIKR